MAIIKKEQVIEPAIFDSFIAETKAAKENVDELAQALTDALKVSKDKLVIADSSTLKSIQDTFKEIKNINDAISEKTKLEKQSAEIGEKLAKLEALKQKAEQERFKALQQLKKVSQEQEKANREQIKNQQELGKVAQQNVKVAQEEEKLKQQQIRTAKALAQESLRLQKEKEKEEKALRDANSSYVQQSKLLNELRKQFKDLAASGQGGSKGAQVLLKQIQTLDKELKDIDASVGQFQRNVGNYDAALDSLGARFRDLGKDIGVAALGVAGLTAAFGGIESALEKIGETNKNLSQTATLTGKQGQELDSFTAKVQALSNTFGEDYNEVLIASNNLSKQFGISQERALELVEQGFVGGANATGEFLEKIKEYPVQFKKAGIGAEDFIKVATTEVKEGVFGDKLLDTIKETGLRLRELPKATTDALTGAFGETFTNDLVKKIKTGEITTKEALIEIRKQIKKNKPDVQALQTLTADLFGGPGEDVGGAVEALNLFDKALNSTGNELNEFQKTQKQQLELNKELEAQQVALARELEPVQKSFQLFFTKVLTAGLSILRKVIDFFRELPAFIERNKVVLIGLGTTLAAIFSTEIIGKIRSLGTAFVGLAKNIGKSSLATSILSKVQKAQAVIQGIVTGQITAQTIAQKSLTVAQNIGTKAVKLFYTVLRSNPIGLIITGITALIGVLALLPDRYQAVIDKQKELNKERQKQRDENLKDLNELKEAQNEEIETLRAAGVNEKKILDERLKNNTEFRKKNQQKRNESLAKIKTQEKALLQLIDERQKIQSKLDEIGFLADVEDVGGGILNKRKKNLDEQIKLVQDNLNKENDLAEKLNKNDRKRAIERLDLLRKIKEEEDKARADKKSKELESLAKSRANRIAAINDQIAFTRLQILQAEKQSKEELELKKTLEDLKVKLTIASNEKITANQRALLKEQAKISKEELQDLFDEELFEKQVNIIQLNFNRLTQIFKLQLANDLITQEEFNDKSIELEIERLEKLVKIREIEGKDVSEQNVKIAQLRKKQRETEVDATLSDLTEAANKEKELEDTFFAQREIALKERAVKEKDLRKNIDDILLDEKIAALEQEQVLIEESGKKRLKAQDEAFEESTELGNEFKKKNEELNKEDAKRQLEIQKELADLKLQQTISDEEKVLQAKKDFLAATVDVFDAAAQLEIDRLEKTKQRIDEEIALREGRINKLQQLADKENSNAAETVAFEERRIAELERKKQQQAVKQKLIELTLSTLRTYQGEIESGKKPSQALASTFKNITLLTNFAKGLQSFEVGTERTSPNENIDGRGGFRAILHPDERVLTKQQNKPLLDAGISNDELPKLALMGKEGMLKSNFVVNPQGNIEHKEVVKEIKGLRSDINQLERVKDVSFDKKTEVITQIIQKVNSKEKRHQKLRNKW